MAVKNINIYVVFALVHPSDTRPHPIAKVCGAYSRLDKAEHIVDSAKKLPGVFYYIAKEKLQ